LYNEQYKKYDWVELDLVKNDSDFRPESYRPYSLDSEIQIMEHIDTSNNWLRNVHRFETVTATGKNEVVRKLPYNFSYLSYGFSDGDFSNELDKPLFHRLIFCVV
jgi:hypothetical protein